MIDVAEISGVDVSERMGRPTMIAIADEPWAYFLADIDDDGPRRWRTVAMPADFARTPMGSNFEAVAWAGRYVVILAEFPASVVVLDADETDRFTLSRLDLVSAGTLADLPADRLHAEALVLLSSGHLLVASELDPCGIFEFGPWHDEAIGPLPTSWLGSGNSWTLPANGEPLRALDWWPVDESIGDVSDLATFNGELYALSDNSQTVNLIAADPRCHRFVIVRTWRITRSANDPKRSNPEGLCFLPDGTCYIAFDRDAGRVNLRRFDPFTASPRIHRELRLRS